MMYSLGILARWLVAVLSRQTHTAAYLRYLWLNQ